MQEDSYLYSHLLHVNKGTADDQDCTPPGTVSTPHVHSDFPIAPFRLAIRTNMSSRIRIAPLRTDIQCYLALHELPLSMCATSCWQLYSIPQCTLKKSSLFMIFNFSVFLLVLGLFYFSTENYSNYQLSVVWVPVRIPLFKFFLFLNNIPCKLLSAV